MELKDNVAIITGSARGIGLGIAQVFARRGAIVAIADLRLSDAEKAAETIVADKGRTVAFEADVTDKPSLDAMVSSLRERYGRIDILVNNAGIEAPPALTKDVTESRWDRVLGVNLKGVFLASQSVIPAMTEQKHGRIINIASIAALRMTFLGSVDYTASKYAVGGLTAHLAWELADSNITVNSVCPGGVMTPGFESVTTPEYREVVTKRLVPLGRFCTIEEIGEVVSFLASDHAAMITGQMLAVDGGILTGYGEDLRSVIRERMAALAH